MEKEIIPEMIIVRRIIVKSCKVISVRSSFTATAAPVLVLPML